MKTKDDIRSRIRVYLRINAISQAWLAKQIEIDPASLSHTLNRRRKLQADEYFAICDVLNVPYDYFKKQKSQIA